MIFKAFKSISVGVLIQLGLGLAVQGLAQAQLYCQGNVCTTQPMACVGNTCTAQSTVQEQIRWALEEERRRQD